MGSMSSDESNYEVILTLSELRGFPVLREGSYKIQASLKDAVQETEEVQSSSHGILFNEDLTWTLSRSTYHSLRSRKVPIRVNVFQNGKKVGLLVLDLKEAFPLPEGTQIEDFVLHKMLTSRVLGAKKDPTLSDHPSLKWLLTINTQPANTEDTPQESERPTQDLIEAILDEKGGFFVIGSNPTHVFHLHIEIYFASNLHLAINKDLLDLMEENEFYFSYDILGETITTVPFTNLKEPNFNVEEATINIHSSFSDIALYFAKQSPFCISVCSTKFILARMYFSLSQMLELTESNLKEKLCLKSNRVFPFENSRDSSMGVSISLKCKGTTTEKEFKSAPTNSAPQTHHVEVSEAHDRSIDISDKKQGTSVQTVQTLATVSKVSAPEISYRLTIDLSSIRFDNSIFRNIRLRYKYSPLMKDENVDTYDFQVQPNVRKTIPYGKCQLTFKAEPQLCFQIFKKNPLTVNILDVKNNLKVIGSSVVDLSKVLVGKFLSPKSKKVEISSPIRNFVNREIGTLECTISLMVEGDHSSDDKVEGTTIENLEEWKSQERQKFEEHFKREWNKRESESMTRINANLQKYDKLEQVVQDYVKKQQLLESSLIEKDKKINDLNRRLSLEGSKFSKKLQEINLQTQELNGVHKDEIGHLKNKIKALEKDIEIRKKTEARMDKTIKDLHNDNAKLSSINDKLKNEVFELQYQINNRKKFMKNSFDERIHDELDAIPSKSADQDHSSGSQAFEEYKRCLEVEKEVRRLVREKETILNTGDYNEDDDLVQSITQQINSLIVPRNKPQK